MKGRHLVLVLAALTLAAGLVHRQEAFPHRSHARLFPLCDACHAGITSGVREETYPAPSQCTSCHDGTREERVDWTGPRTRESNLDFSHTQHAGTAAAAGDTLACESCHSALAGTRMAVAAATPDACLGCHAHQASEHLAAGRDCAVCHRPLAETRLDTARIARFEQPPTHGQSAFLLEHAPAGIVDQAACATCHTRESCTRCHFDTRLPAIDALPADARMAALQRDRPAEYPEPVSHSPSSWTRNHGSTAMAADASCGNCHTQRSCATCHRDRLTAAAAALPVTTATDPRGVQLSASARLHRANFMKEHASDAAVGESSCNACHETRFCESCHSATSAPPFHLSNFMARHGPEAYANESDCASCHNAELFCRSCHTGTGLASKGRLGVAFHTANAFWIVGHGVAARQGLEGCASCHTQSSCTQCHSAVGSWRINPHGPRFDAARIESANRLTCRLCHLAGGTSP